MGEEERRGGGGGGEEEERRKRGGGEVEGAVVGEADGAGSGGAGLVPAPQPSSLHQGFNTAQLQGYCLENVP